MILLWYYSYVCYHVFCFSLVVWFSCWRGVNDVTIDMFSLKIGNYQIKLLIYLSSTLSWIFLMCSSFLQPNMLKTSILFPNDGFPFGFSTMFSWNHLDTMWKQPRLICCKSPKKRACSRWNNPKLPGSPPIKVFPFRQPSRRSQNTEGLYMRKKLSDNDGFKQ